jgi:multidrug resistance efflux pump
MERVIEMTEAEKRQGVGANSSNNNSLMVLRNQLERANQEHLAKLDLRQGKARARNLDICAYVDGAVYGNEVRLGRQDASILGRLTATMR